MIEHVRFRPTLFVSHVPGKGPCHRRYGRHWEKIEAMKWANGLRYVLVENLPLPAGCDTNTFMQNPVYPIVEPKKDRGPLEFGLENIEVPK